MTLWIQKLSLKFEKFEKLYARNSNRHRRSKETFDIIPNTAGINTSIGHFVSGSSYDAIDEKDDHHRKYIYLCSGSK